jgi:alkanesulfonate monooxygenase SsuD/methylene tetrahydromethanopterin reductase-like flavin-dependent oxidoreductase (luciferase family)
MEIGIDSFAAFLPDPTTGTPPSGTDRVADLLEEIEIADQVGLDVFGMGEYYRAEFLDSVPAIIPAAAAARTKTIRLPSAVTVLSAADPVRVFREFATLDLISKGRAEIVVGRGSFGGKRRRFKHPLQHPCGREKRAIEKGAKNLSTLSSTLGGDS